METKKSGTGALGRGMYERAKKEDGNDKKTRIETGQDKEKVVGDYRNKTGEMMP